MNLTVDRILEKLNYLSDTGEFVWKRTGKRAGCTRVPLMHDDPMRLP